jgi:hypothetical protein
MPGCLRLCERVCYLQQCAVLTGRVLVGAALMPARFMGSRVPLPEPQWKQQDGIEGTVATGLDMATGLERAEMLAAMEGRNIFDDAVSATLHSSSNTTAAATAVIEEA